MRFLLNIIWLVFGGFWLALSYGAIGLLLCIPIVSIPLGVACLRMASYAFWPFGRSVIPKPGPGVLSTTGNVVWFLTFGLVLALSHLITAIVQAFTIIGLPLAVANLKMIPVTCLPFGKQIVPNAMLRPGQPGYGQPFYGN